jgi:anaerobic selenocysteine-containing dehydrogenase
MGEKKEIITFCPMCVGRCSRKAVVENGRLIEWDRELESGMPTEFCPTAKSKAYMEIYPHPDRIKFPQKRVGGRGEGKWERISWDEALNNIAQKFTQIRDQFGPESIALALGEPKGMEYAFAQRFASALGTPNVATPGHLCGGPTIAASFFTYGGFTLADEEHKCGLTILWGSNPIHTNAGMRRECFRSVLIEGAKLVVIDPKMIDIAKRADLWIRPRPGSDGALALGLLKVVVEDRIYDKEFVGNWTIGFEHLQKSLKKFSLEDVANVTWVPRQHIEKLARLYVQNRPASIQWGNALEQVSNPVQACRAICILRAITGNISIRGGEIFTESAAFTRPGRFMLLSKYPRRPEKTLGNEYKWAMMTAFIPYQSLVKGILEEKPYPIKAVLVVLSNPLLGYPNAKEAFRAFMKLDFIVVSEIFMTPTAAMADLVLPAATGGEHDTVGYWPPDGEIRAYPKIVEPQEECWSDMKMINELAKRLNLKKDYWNNEEESLDLMLQPSGLSYHEFKKKRILEKKIQPFGKYKETGFKTPSKKAEIYSEQMKDFGYSPFPYWEELSKFHYEISSEYPLLLTNAKEEAYYLSGYKHVDYLRKIKPLPTVEMNPETARQNSLKEGEWVYIETKTGRIKQKLVLDPNLDPRVVFGSFGWWFPEEPVDLYSWNKSNINVLTESGPPSDVATGAVVLRVYPT